VKTTLLDSGLNEEQVAGLLGRIAVESNDAKLGVQWTDELNRRRFELVDADIQRTLSPAEQLELAGLTQLTREFVESEENLPFKGIQQLHRRLLDTDQSDETP